MSLDAPILFIVFNRPDTTTLVFETIRQVRPRQLFIAADGPRENCITDKERCAKAREIALKVDWKCEVHTLFQEKNQGCRFGPSTAISWFFNNVEQGIILEDDCLPNESFFKFCSEMLDRYRNDQRIFSINGSNLGYAPGYDHSYSFSTFMNMWGWATWRRVANLIDYDLLYWRKMKFKKLWLFNKLNSLDQFEIDFNWILYWEERIKWLLDGFETWDYQWMLHQLKYNMLSVVPARNMVTNIGFGTDATHTTSPDYPTALLDTNELEFPLVHPSNVINDIVYLNNFVKKIWACEYKKESLINLIIKDKYLFFR